MGSPLQLPSWRMHCSPWRWALVAVALAGAVRRRAVCSWLPRASVGRGPGHSRRAAAGPRRRSVGSVVRVITYNVLNPLLCSPKRFPHCRPEDLGEAVRWNRVSAKIEAALATEWPTVVCLQEVDEKWAGRLHTLFQKRGWHFAFALTPMTTFLPMGVALAWPNNMLQLEELRIFRPGASVQCPAPQQPTWRQRFLSAISRGAWGADPRAAQLEPWTQAARKQNRLLVARFQLQSSSVRFVVATYHMPCLFGDLTLRQTKAIHAAILHNRVAAFAGTLDFVLAGDFNTVPGDSELGIVTRGSIGAEDAARPPSVEGLDIGTWERQGCAPVRSAYAVALGKEPEFTNFAWIEDAAKPFRETIDYIFISERIEVVNVTQLPSATVEDPPYPSEDQPSDHVLLAADVRFGVKGG